MKTPISKTLDTKITRFVEILTERNNAANTQVHNSLIVISGASGSGKTTLLRALEKQGSVRQLVSCTTRAQRPGEVNGIDYHFFSKEEFLEKLEAGEFLEHAEVHGNYYGLLQAHAEALLDLGEKVAVILDPQGHRIVRQKMPVLGIFLDTGSLQDLQGRLEARGDKAESVALRIKNAEAEIEAAEEYDFVVGGDAEEVLKQVAEII